MESHDVSRQDPEEILKTLPTKITSFSGIDPMYNYKGFWYSSRLVKFIILAQRNFKAQPTNVILSSSPKTGTTWLKSLAYAIATRKQFGVGSTNPLHNSVSHDCIPFIEFNLSDIEKNQENHDSLPLLSTHMPYSLLPESIISSDCKIVYMYRDAKDMIVSLWHFSRKLVNMIPGEEPPFEKGCEDFCEGVSWAGPYWDHIRGYWKASLERPGRILILKYEDVMNDTPGHVKKLAEFIGYPFSEEEEKDGVVEGVVKLCSFNSLKTLEVNKTGKFSKGSAKPVENQHYFRKAEVGDWKNHFSPEMKDKIDRIMEQKLSGFGIKI